jgi:Ca2+-binding EF-hand superfamily protein
MEDFIENFNQEMYNHMRNETASLFNFLDKHQTGKIEFMDFVAKLYPTLTDKHLLTIRMWNDEYNRNFNIDKKIKVNQDDEGKKRVLPRTCLTRLEELYRFFDT